MKNVMADLKAFHTTFDVPILSAPAFPSQERIELRDRLLKEEVAELDAAIKERDIVEVADALGDIIYIAAGTALEFGIPLERVWDEIQRSNMAKVHPDGTVKRRDDGKILKPDGWTAPDIAKALS